MKRRILSIITALALCLSLCPTWAFAVEGEPDTGLCAHHREHIGCGYIAPTEGQPCGHRHTAECYPLGVLPDGDSGEYYETGADAEILDCQHAHDGECGYVQAGPGQPCGYECRICPIEDLIAALPSRVTEDNRADVEAQLQEILDLYRELNEEEREQINLSRCQELQWQLDAASVPAPAEESVTYQEASWNGSEVTYTGKTADNCTPVADSNETVTWAAGWYVVNSTVTIDQPITVNGVVNLILADGCTLNAEKGIVVTTGNSLNIYAQKNGTGTLTATGTTDSNNNASAGIGGSGTTPNSGTITIHGGVINAIGGVSSIGDGAAGIGGGTVRNGNGGSSGTVTIYGGTVTANSGTGNISGAGIGGGGSQQGTGGTGDNITIYGGNVTAEAHGTSAGGSGAGIGGGFGSNDGGAGSNIQIHGGTVHATGGYYGAGIGGGGGSKSGDGAVTISGGEVTAVGGRYAAGIGGGGGYKSESWGITTVVTGGTGSVTITGGIVDAKGGAGNSSGDYAGDHIGNGGNASGGGTAPTLTGAIVFENGVGTVYGTVTLTEPFTVPDGYSLTFAEGGKFNGNYAFYKNGSPIELETVKTDGVTGPAAVRECQHTGAQPTSNSDGTHSMDCPYCGYTKAAENCDYGEYTSDGDTNHVQTCKLCGYKKVEGHTIALTAEASVNTVTLKAECGICQYGNTVGTVTVTFPQAAYGQTGQTVTLTGIPAGYIIICQVEGGSLAQSQDGDTNLSWTLAYLFDNAKMTAGDHDFFVHFATWDGKRTEPCKLTLHIDPAPLTPSITGETNKTYDGTTTAPAGLAITLNGIVGSDTVTATATDYAYDNANAGENKTITASGITLSGADAGNYELTSNSVSIGGTITKANQAAPAAPAATDENIKDTSITLNTIANAEYSKDGATWQASPEFTGLAPNTAYTFYARLKGDANRNPSPAGAGTSITTKKMLVSDATVTVSGAYTYNGAAQTPIVTVVKNGKTLTEGTDYTVTCTNNTNAGAASVTITGMGDYEGTNSKTFTIRRKALTVTGAAARDRAYNGVNTVQITGVTLDGIVGSDEVSVDTANLTGTLNGSNVGRYTAVTLPALTLTGGGADNYTLTRPAGAVSTSVTISKAPALTPKTGDLAVANNQAHTYTFGLGALRPDLPAGMSFGSSAVTYELGTVSLGGYYTGGAKIEDQTLSLPIQAVDSKDVKGIGTITVTIHTGNFEDMTATINVRSVNKTIPTGEPALSANTLTYGQPLSTITLSGGMADNATPVPGKFEWSSPDNRPAVQDSYDAAWVFTPTDNNAYAIVNGIAAIRVVPAPITGAEITLSETAYRYDGAAHSPSITGVKLGDTTLTADTDYTAAIPAGTEAGTYTVTVTGKGNYTGTATITFTINPVEAGDEFEGEGGTVLRLEVETGLSSVPAALENNSKYDTPEKIENELRTRVEQAMSNVGKNIAVFDVTLQYKDESGTWRNVDPNDFPKDGVTAILPYPAGTGMTGYTFTVQHLISSGDKAGEMETLSYELTADGLKCKFNSLSPVAIGYQAASKPVDPTPTPPSTSGGGGWSVSTYAVTVEKAAHGKVVSNRTNASSGSTVTLTVTPDSGYVLDTLTVSDSRGSTIKLTAQGDGKYTFTMPGRAVTVKAVFAPLPADVEQPCDGGADCPSCGFTDLGGVGTWYHEAVDYVLRNGLMNGYSSETFGPNDNLSRAMLAQILYNRAGRPAVTGGSIFADVAAGQWYTNAVIWANQNGIVGGYGNGMFGPNDNITREQLAVMLWRYAGSPAATDKELHFTDADEAGGWALDALRWGTENGVLNGYGDGRLGPKGLATRAQVAQMLKNFLKEK